MAQQTQSRRIVDNTRSQLGLLEEGGSIPKMVMPNIQPTFQVNDEIFNKQKVLATVTATGTIYTTLSRPRQQFMLKHAEWALSAASDSASGNGHVTIVVGGDTFSICIGSLQSNIINSTGPVLSTNGQASVTFDNPIPIDNNTAITFVAPNLADSVIRATISGYYTELA